MTTPDLRRIQELFWALISAPEGVGPALDDLARRGEIDATGLDELFAGDDRLPAVKRLDIYANMYFFRLLDCLKEDFPKTHAAIGADRFHNLVTDYLLRHPSEHPSLRYLGRRFPEFIATHPIVEECPWLPGLARLEWARAEVFDAPDAVPLTREKLSGLPQDRAGEARFELVPAFDLLHLEHDVVPLWRALDKDIGRSTTNETRRLARPPTRRRTAVRVWRHDLVVYHASLDEEEALCLDLVRAGEPLARVCQRLAAGWSLTRATERVGRILQGWIDDGLLAAYSLSE
jgi:putative DNA-binding protein